MHFWVVNDPGVSSKNKLTAAEIKGAFQELSDKLAARGAVGEICLFGGAVMVLAFNARVSTKDVDGVFHPAQIIRELAHEIAEEKNWDEHWLNDGVKGFVTSAPALIESGLPQFSNLRLTRPTAEYLLAMKCMAERTGVEGVTDIPDIIFLIGELGLKSSGAVLDLVGEYYGKSGIPVKTQYLVEGLFEEGKL